MTKDNGYLFECASCGSRQTYYISHYKTNEWQDSEDKCPACGDSAKLGEWIKVQKNKRRLSHVVSCDEMRERVRKAEDQVIDGYFGDCGLVIKFYEGEDPALSPVIGSLALSFSDQDASTKAAILEVTRLIGDGFGYIGHSITRRGCFYEDAF